MNEELLKELNNVIKACFDDPPIALYKDINPITRKAINTALSLNLIYEHRPHQYKLNENGMKVIQLGSIERYLEELNSSSKQNSTNIINHGNFVIGDNSGTLNQSSDNFSNNRTTETTNNITTHTKSKMSIIEWAGLILGIIVSIIVIYQFLMVTK